MSEKVKIALIVMIGIIIAVSIHACANRYVPVPDGHALDRWTGMRMW
jgi:hypothetical protein